MRDRARTARRYVRPALALGAVAVDLAVLRSRGYRLGGNVVVRCRRGHLFTTLWIPAASLKALRLGPYRFQRCPVGRHWSFVTPVRESTLADDDLRAARDTRDVRIP